MQIEQSDDKSRGCCSAVGGRDSGVETHKGEKEMNEPPLEPDPDTLDLGLLSSII